MSQKVTALIITGYGTNCEVECAYAAKEGGADSVITAHFSDIVQSKVLLSDINFIVFPGGFLDGDDLGAAQAAAQRWKHTKVENGQPLVEQLMQRIKAGAAVLGICNGFQLLVKLGLLPALDNAYLTRQVSLSHNASARYEDRWCHLTVNEKSPCIFTKGLKELYLPVRHGEGNLIPDNENVLSQLVEKNLIPVQYANPKTGKPTEEYPYNPNGSVLGIAGLCDPSGRIFGLMPHPEAYNDVTNHPGWTRGESAELGTVLFKNAIQYLKK